MAYKEGVSLTLQEPPPAQLGPWLVKRWVGGVKRHKNPLE